MAHGSLPSVKKNKSLWTSANQNNQMLNFDSELFPQTLFFMLCFSIVSIHLRRDQGELRGTSVVHAMSSAGHKQRSQGGATPGSGRPSVKSTTTKPIWEVTTRGTRVSGQEKKWAKRLYIIKPKGFDWLNVVLFWLPILNLDEFGIIWGYLGTPSHQMPLLKFFTSIWCGKWQECAANPNTLETTQSFFWHDSDSDRHMKFSTGPAWIVFTLVAGNAGCIWPSSAEQCSKPLLRHFNYILVSSFGPLEWLVAILK